MTIHPSAMIDSAAKIGNNVEIGPFSVIEGNVEIGDNTKIGANTSILKGSRIGTDNKIGHNVVIAAPPQDFKYKDEESYVIIGDNNLIREFVSINLATGEGNATKIGSNNMLMTSCHIAHNCTVGSNIIMANLGTLGGHVTMHDNVNVGGMTAIHQFVQIGKFTMLGGCSKIIKDVPPFICADGHPAEPFGLNSIGLKRNGFSTKDILEIKNAYKIVYRSKLRLEEAIEKLEKEYSDNPNISYFTEFIKTSKRGIIR